MEYSVTVVRDDDDDNNEEWSSFCSSCRSILQTIYSTGEPSFLNDIIDELFEKSKINKQIGKNGNITKNINTINLEIDTNESNNDGIKKTELNPKFDKKENSVILNTLEHEIVLIKSNSSDNVNDETLRSVISLNKSHNKTNYNSRKNILDHHRKILKLTKSILHLSNYINVMRKIILEEIHKKTTCPKGTMSKFCYSHN